MLGKFWEGVGADLGKKWLERIFSPAFMFWMGGAGAMMLSQGAANGRAAWDSLWSWLNAQSAMTQGGLALGALLLVVVSSLLMETLRFTFLRLLEGYWPWPFRPLAVWFSRLAAWFIRRDEGTWQRLKTQEEKSGLSDGEHKELGDLEVRLHYVPVNPADTMPVGLGNILRAGEGASFTKYGLDAVVCWPRLWLLLPKEARDGLAAARQALEQRVELWAWGLLFLIWTVWTPWAIPVGLVWLALAYALCRQAAMGYADLIETAFDLYRWELYKSLHFPLPARAVQEREQGLKLTAFLWRGESSGITFHHPPE